MTFGHNTKDCKPEVSHKNVNSNTHYSSQHSSCLSDMVSERSEESQDSESGRMVKKLYLEVREADKVTPFVDKIIEDRPYGPDGIVLPYRFSDEKIAMLKLQYEKNSEWTSKMRKELAKKIVEALRSSMKT